MYIFGGYYPSGTGILDDMIMLDCDKAPFELHRIVTSDGVRPVQRNGHSATLFDDKLFVYGGWTGNGVDRQLCVFDLTLKCWTFPVTYGSAPLLPNLHIAEYDESLQKVVVFGGGDGRRFVNDLTYLDVKSLCWTKVHAKGVTPEERTNHSSCISYSTLYVFGGWNRRTRFNDIHILQMSMYGATWSSPKADNPPSKRTAATMVVFRDRVLLFGGQTGGPTTDLYIYDRQQGCWLPSERKPSLRSDMIKLTGVPPPPCYGHTIVPVRSNLLLIYGGDDNDLGNMHTIYTLEEQIA